MTTFKEHSISQNYKKVDVQNEDLWKVEEILKTRGKGRKKQYYVKWLQWPKKFNSWLNASDVKNL